MERKRYCKECGHRVRIVRRYYYSRYFKRSFKKYNLYHCEYCMANLYFFETFRIKGTFAKLFDRIGVYLVFPMIIIGFIIAGYIDNMM